MGIAMVIYLKEIFRAVATAKELEFEEFLRALDLDLPIDPDNYSF